MNLSVAIYKITVALIGLFLISTIFALPSLAQRTQTVFTASGQGVTVIPYVRADKNAMFVDFEHANFNNIEYIYFNLNYDSDEPETKRGVEGSFIPTQTEVSGHYNNKPYYRYELIFGTCSKDVCTYDDGVRDVKLTVNTKFLTGQVDQHTQVLTFPQDQF